MAKSRPATTSSARELNAVDKAKAQAAWTSPALGEWAARTTLASKAGTSKARRARARVGVTISYRLDAVFWRISSRVEMKPAT